MTSKTIQTMLISIVLPSTIVSGREINAILLITPIPTIDTINHLKAGENILEDTLVPQVMSTGSALLCNPVAAI